MRPDRRASLAGCIALVAALVLAAFPAAAGAGTFAVDCGLSHRAPSDPIVHPGMPGMSHSHDFYGSRDTAAGSTYATMTAARTSCADGLDTAGYWHPTLSVAGVPVRGRVTAYYGTAGKPTVRPYPRDLRSIAGSAKATRPPSPRVAYWHCARPGAATSGAPAPARAARSATPPRCARRTNLALVIRFRDCWNGVDLDSADHQSHLRYSRRGRCPKGYPQALPDLAMQVTWPVRPAPADVTLASGAPHTMHADFWNTWHQPRLRRLTNQCLLIATDCGLVRHAPR